MRRTSRDGLVYFKIKDPSTLLSQAITALLVMD